MTYNISTKTIARNEKAAKPKVESALLHNKNNDVWHNKNNTTAG
jgi:hypothetical protein